MPLSSSVKSCTLNSISAWPFSRLHVPLSLHLTCQGSHKVPCITTSQRRKAPASQQGGLVKPMNPSRPPAQSICRNNTIPHAAHEIMSLP